MSTATSAQAAPAKDPSAPPAPFSDLLTPRGAIPTPFPVEWIPHSTPAPLPPASEPAYTCLLRLSSTSQLPPALPPSPTSLTTPPPTLSLPSTPPMYLQSTFSPPITPSSHTLGRGHRRRAASPPPSTAVKLWMGKEAGLGAPHTVSRLFDASGPPSGDHGKGENSSALRWVELSGRTA